MDKWFNRINELIYHVATELGPSSVVDVIKILSEEQANDLTLVPDGVHPSLQGTALIASRIVSTLAKE